MRWLGIVRGRRGFIIGLGEGLVGGLSGFEVADVDGRYFGFNATATKTLNTVLGYDPTVPHWGWNGNARRYWDNM